MLYPLSSGILVGGPIESDATEWQATYAHRSGIERMFDRLKGFRRLNRLTMRGLDKVSIHCVASDLTAMVRALAALLLGHDDLIRSTVLHVHWTEETGQSVVVIVNLAADILVRLSFPPSV